MASLLAWLLRGGRRKEGDPPVRRAIASGWPVALALLALIGLLILLADRWYARQLLQAERARLSAELTPYGSGLQNGLDRRFGRLEALKAFVQADLEPASLAVRFPPFAAGLHTRIPGLRNLAIAPTGVVAYVYPPGGDLLPGEDLLELGSPALEVEDRRALDRGQVVVSEPYPLPGGDQRVSALQAVFLGDIFWGLVHIDVDIQPLLEEAGLGAESSELELALRDDLSGEVFFGRPEVFASTPVLYQLELPEGGWTLAGMPAGGWGAAMASPRTALRGAGLLIAVLVAALTYVAIGQQARLSRAVRQRTAELNAELAERARAEKALREGEALLQTILETLPVGVWLLDEGGKIYYGNTAAQQIWAGSQLVGTERFDEYRGWRVETGERIAPEEWAAARAIRQGETSLNELIEIEAFDGKRKVILNSAVPILHGGKVTGAVAVNQDITRLERVQRELRESEERFARAVLASPVAISLSTLTEGRLVDANEAFLELFGYTRGELIGRTTRELNMWVEPEDRDRMLARVLSDGRIPSYESVFNNRSGHPLDLMASFVLVELAGETYLLSQLTDITERKRTERELGRTMRALRVRSAANAAMARSSTEADLYMAVCKILVEVGKYPFAWVGLVEQDPDRSVRPAAWAGEPADYALQLHPSWAEDEEGGRGPTGSAIRAGRPVIARDLPGEAPFASWQEAAGRAGFRASIALPIAADGRVLGTINIYAAESEAFDLEEMGLLQNLAEDLSFGVAALQTRADRERAMVDLEKSQRRFFQLFQSSPLGISLSSFPDGRYLDANAAFLEMHGYTREELVGRTSTELGLWADPGQRGRLISVLEAVGRVEGFEADFFRQDGRRISVLFSVELIELEGQTWLLTQAMDITERKRAERAIQESEARFRAVFEGAGIGINLTTPDGTLAATNPALTRLLGYEREELWGRNYLDYTHPEDAQIQQELEAQVFAGQIPGYQIEKRLLHKDGRTLWGRLTVSPVLGASERPLFSIGMIEDITESKQAEQDMRAANEALQKSQATLARAQALAHVGSWEVEFSTQAVFLSEETCRIHGLDPRETNVSLERMLSTVPPEDLEQLRRVSWEAMEVEGPYELEYRVPRPDGSVRFVHALAELERDEAGRPARLVGMSQDVTGRKLAEEELRRYTERLKTLYDIDREILAAQSPQGVARTALAHLRVLMPDCERASVSLFDWEKGESELLAVDTERATGVRVGQRDLLIPEMTARLREGRPLIVPDMVQMEQESPSFIQLRQEGMRSMAVLPLTASGELIGVLTLSSESPAAFSPEQLDTAGEVAIQLAIAIRQARLYQELERYAAELEERVSARTEELEAKNRELETFTYSVSHDLKAPLRGIDGYSRLLLEEYDERLDEDGRAFLRTIRKATAQMTQLIEDLLAYSRLERRAPTRAALDLPRLVQAVVANRADELRQRGVDLAVDIPCRTVVAEPEGLSQALRNLLDNALKFTQATSEPRIEIGCRQGEASCVVWVRDNGIGFEMKYQERIFEIFQRLHRAEEFPGTGIGLAIVAKAMQRIGGRAWAESIPGQGATFFLEIPT